MLATALGALHSNAAHGFQVCQRLARAGVEVQAPSHLKELGVTDTGTMCMKVT